MFRTTLGPQQDGRTGLSLSFGVTANGAGHVRTVPVPDWVRGALDKWLAAAAIAPEINGIGAHSRCVAGQKSASGKRGPYLMWLAV